MKRVVVVVSLAISATLGAQNDPVNATREVKLDVVPHRDLPLISRHEPPPSERTHSNRPRPELGATLLPLDQSNFRWGDEFVFQLRIKNVGPIPVTLPWAADGLVPEEADHAAGHVYRAAVFIMVESVDGSRKLAWLYPQGLAGAKNAPGTLQVLPPGQTALLRIPAKWSTDGDSTFVILKQPGGQVRIRGRLTLLDEGVSAESSNASAPNKAASRWSSAFLQK